MTSLKHFDGLSIQSNNDQQRDKLKIFSVASVPHGKNPRAPQVSFNEKSLSVFAIEVWLQG